MPATYEPIASTTLGSAAADVTFSSIPGTYTDLVLVVHGKKSTGTGTDDYKVTLNSDSGSNYSDTFLFGNGSSASSGRDSNLTYAPVGRFASSTASPSTTVVNIMSYANTNVFKTLLDASGSDSDLIRRVLLWRSTNAVTTVKVEGSYGISLASGTTVSLYGIKAA